MKTVVIIHVIAALIYVASIIWTLIEALNYFIKDDPFNFGCLWLLGSGVVLVVIIILAAFSNDINKK